MSSTFIRTAAVVCALAAALALGAVAQAATPQNAQLGQPVRPNPAVIARHEALARLGERRVYTDPAVVARHRALARLGERQVYTDPAVVARHRALARLGETPVPAKRVESSGSFPWQRSTLELVAAIGLILLTAGYLEARRLRVGGAS